MDGSRFDAISRALATGHSRRRALGGLLLGSLGLLGRGNVEDAEAHDLSKKCKKKSGEQKKKCLKKARKHRAEHARESQPVACTSPCPVCQTCSNGACVPNRAADDGACNFDGKCLNGTCNPVPLCFSQESFCTAASADNCCSNMCVDDLCEPGNPGDMCHVRTDCNGVGCVGFRCQ